MKASMMYRIASVLLVVLAVGHTLGFRKIDPKWGVDSLVGGMRSIHFEVQGFSRTYWDFYVGCGLFVSVFLLFMAVLAWQLAGLPAQTLAALRGTVWSLGVCFVAVAFLNWRYFFLVPILLSILIIAFLIVGAWISRHQAEGCSLMC